LVEPILQHHNLEVSSIVKTSGSAESKSVPDIVKDDWSIEAWHR